MPEHDAVPLDSETECQHLVSRPALMVDLALAYLPRRMVMCQGLCAILGKGAMEKTATRWTQAVEAVQAMESQKTAGYGIREIGRLGREAVRAVSALEDSIWGLLVSATKHAKHTQEVSR